MHQLSSTLFIVLSSILKLTTIFRFDLHSSRFVPRHRVSLPSSGNEADHLHDQSQPQVGRVAGVRHQSARSPTGGQTLSVHLQRQEEEESIGDNYALLVILFKLVTMSTLPNGLQTKTTNVDLVSKKLTVI